MGSVLTIHKHRLVQSDLRNTAPGTWLFELPVYYTRLFSIEEPSIMSKSNTGWRIQDSGSNMAANFLGLEESELERMRLFCEQYKQFVILGLTDALRNYYSNELDFSIALDFTALSAWHIKHKYRTNVGELTYQAKYWKNRSDAIKLSKLLISGIERVVKGKVNGKVKLSFIPPDTDQMFQFYLPRQLVCSLIDNRRLNSIIDKEDPLIKTSLIRVKQRKFKNLELSEKIRESQRIYSSQNIKLQRGLIESSNIIFIDDYYKSGSTAWAYARFLKSQGAASVSALVCLKNLSDR